MNRNDWLWFALKAYGIYLLAGAALTLPTIAMAPSGAKGSLIFSMLLSAGAGGYLLIDGSHLLQLANRRGPATPPGDGAAP